MTNNVYIYKYRNDQSKAIDMLRWQIYINIFGMLHFLVALDCFFFQVCSQIIKDGLEEWVSSFFSSWLRLIITVASLIVISSYGVNRWLLQSVNNHKNQAEWIFSCVNGTWVLNLLRIFQSKFFIWVTATRGGGRLLKGITRHVQLH